MSTDRRWTHPDRPVITPALRALAIGTTIGLAAGVLITLLILGAIR